MGSNCSFVEKWESLPTVSPEQLRTRYENDKQKEVEKKSVAEIQAIEEYKKCSAKIRKFIHNKCLKGFQTSDDKEYRCDFYPSEIGCAAPGALRNVCQELNKQGINVAVWTSNSLHQHTLSLAEPPQKGGYFQIGSGGGGGE